MKDIKLDLRLRNILQQLCLKENYITISEIAKELGVSSRTVLRELPAVEKWLKHRGYFLDKKTGVGIRIKGSKAEKSELCKVIDIEEGEVSFSPEERVVLTISELLMSNEPVKLYNFTRILKVTEGTISNDLDKVEEWLKRHHIELIRKPGLGIYIKAKEDDIRKAMVDLLYENIGDDRLLALVRNNLPQAVDEAGKTENIIKHRLLNLIDIDIIKKLIALVRELEKNMGYRLTDNAYIALIVHVAVMIQRRRKNETICMDEKLLETLKDSRELSLAKALCEEVAKQLNIHVPDDEVCFIAMHIKGAKSYEGNEENTKRVIGNYQLVKLSKEIIRIAEKETGKFLGHNEGFLVGLVNHLGPALSRLKMNLEIRNPLLEEIKAHYSELYKLSEKCAAPVEKFLGCKMPEAEIGYIAMHLGAVIENSEALERRIYRVAIACTSGIGTSRLLATRIQKEYDNIEIVDIISLLHLEEGMIKEKAVEFIISTVKLTSAPIPVVTINPLLFEEDKIKISKQIKVLESTAVVRPLEKKKKLDLKDKLLRLNCYGEAIMQLLDNFFLLEDSNSNTLDEIINTACEKITFDRERAEKLKEAMKAREEKGGTFLTGHSIILLHCRTSAVDKLLFGAVKPQKVMSFINAKNLSEKMELAVIMAAPENCDKRFIETISYVSRMLIERSEFPGFLKKGNRDEAYRVLSSILEEFYRGKDIKYMEG